jgi:hypothetical protein
LRGRGDLKLGMVVEVRGRSSDASHHASDIRFGSEIVGPVGVTLTTSANGGTFSLLGQKVSVDASTVFDNSLATKFAAIQPGQILEVHGLLDAAGNVYNATRIELKSNATALFKLRGVIDSVNPPTFTIGGETSSYASLSQPAAGLVAAGRVVRIKLQPNQVGGVWIVTQLKDGARHPEDQDEAEVKGMISKFSSISDFMIGDMKVNASGVSNPGIFALGAFVEVEGPIVEGVLKAIKAHIEDSSSAGSAEFEFHRRIMNLSLDKSTFQLGTDSTISVDANTTFLRGATPGGIDDGDCVEVKAVAQSGTTALRATLIKFDNSCPP